MEPQQRFLREAIRLLRQEAPRHAEALASELGSVVIRCQTSGETFDVGAHGGHVVVQRPRRRLNVVRVAVAAPDVVRLIDGSVMLETLLASEAVLIAGNPDHLLVLASALRLVIDGGLRSRPMQALFERYRQWVLREASGLPTEASL